MRLTERVLTSWAVRKPKSTPVMAEETGCEVFMTSSRQTLECACCPKQLKRRKRTRTVMAGIFFELEKVRPRFSRCAKTRTGLNSVLRLPSPRPLAPCPHTTPHHRQHPPCRTLGYGAACSLDTRSRDIRYPSRLVWRRWLRARTQASPAVVRHTTSIPQPEALHRHRQHA